MRYNLLGNTGLYVSELCLGSMTFGGEGFWANMGTLKQDAVNSQLKTAFDAGINFIDTANVYSFGQSETLVGQGIRDLGLPRDQLIVATKSTGAMNELPNGRGQSRYHIFNQVDASLKRLQLDHIDLYQLHGFDPVTPLEESLAALNDVVRSGKVRYIGLCNMAAWQIMKGLGISERKGYARFESVQSFYTVASRDLDREVVPLMRDQKLGLMVWSPLAGGLLSGKYERPKAGAASANDQSATGGRRTSFDFPIVDKERAYRCIDAMRPIAAKHDVSIARVAIAWLLSRPHVSTVIIGARTAEQLTDNIAATQVKLTAEDLRALDEVSALPPEYPGWMIQFQGDNLAKAPYLER